MEGSDKSTKLRALAKRNKARLASKATNKARRSNLGKKVIELKLDSAKLSKAKLVKINKVFLESKWIKNAAMSNDPFTYVAGDNVDVLIFNPVTQKCDIVENRDLTIGSQLKQHAVKQVQKDICNLAKKKAKGLKVGELRWCKVVNSVTFAQYGVTYSQCTNKNHFKLQKIGKVKFME